MLSSHLRLGLPSSLFPSCFHTKTLYTALLSPIRATCPTHLTLLYFITRTTLCEQYRSLNSSLCNFLHSLLPRPSKAQILSSTPCSQTPSAYVPPSMSATNFTPIQDNGQNYSSISWSLNFWTATWMTEYSAPNNSTHSLTSACS